MTTPVAVLHVQGTDSLERALQLPSNGRVKLGRAVGKHLPTASNGVFDSLVLSRNHAELWWDSAKQQLYIQDTGSANGTFVNGSRLSASGQPSLETVVDEGAVLQLGEDYVSAAGTSYQCVKATVAFHWPEPTTTEINDMASPATKKTESTTMSQLSQSDASSPAFLAQHIEKTASAGCSRADSLQFELNELQQHLSKAQHRQSWPSTNRTDNVGQFGDVEGVVKAGQAEADKLIQRLSLLDELLNSITSLACQGDSEMVEILEKAKVWANEEREAKLERLLVEEKALQREKESLLARRCARLEVAALVDAELKLKLQLEADLKANEAALLAASITQSEVVTANQTLLHLDERVEQLRSNLAQLAV